MIPGTDLTQTLKMNELFSPALISLTGPLTCTDEMLSEAQQKINHNLVVLGEWLAAINYQQI